MKTLIETVVIGAGQAGLAASYFLTKAGRAHVVLERAASVANAWRNQRWDSFTLVTPNFQVRMPGAEYQGPDPYGFMTRAQVVAYFDSYVRRFQLPVRCNVEVTSVERDNDAYRIRTSVGEYRAQNVIVAIGHYQSPKLPPFSESLSADIRQLHPMEYRNPSLLPPGAVLVVGTGQSGAQIAEELYQSGRRVYLSVGSAGRVPRRYRGRDINEWFTRTGAFDTKLEELASSAARFTAHPQISGKNGGETLNLHQFARDGVQLLGHARDVRGSKLMLAPDLYETLALVDQFEIDTLKMIDEYIDRMSLNAPAETIAHSQDGYQQSLITELDLKASGITSVLWATGYTFDFHIVKLPVFDQSGYPIHSRGITRYQGLYFLGLPWLHTRGSGILYGVGEDASFITANIATRSMVSAAAA
jgi:putative flavoprotein involved in K+ transport